MKSILAKQAPQINPCLPMRVWHTTQTGGSSQAAIGLAIDVSRSMKGAPLDAARQAAASFIKAKRPNDLIGIYSFGHTANRNRLATAPIAASSMTPAQPTLSAEVTASPAEASARKTKPSAAQRQAPAGMPRLLPKERVAII